MNRGEDTFDKIAMPLKKIFSVLNSILSYSHSSYKTQDWVKPAFNFLFFFFNKAINAFTTGTDSRRFLFHCASIFKIKNGYLTKNCKRTENCGGVDCHLIHNLLAVRNKPWIIHLPFFRNGKKIQKLNFNTSSQMVRKQPQDSEPTWVHSKIYTTMY